jgi:hypothetical protein
MHWRPISSWVKKADTRPFLSLVFIIPTPFICAAFTVHHGDAAPLNKILLYEVFISSFIQFKLHFSFW